MTEQAKEESGKITLKGWACQGLLGGTMVLQLTPEVEQHFRDVVEDSFYGNTQIAVASMLSLHEKYGWKEQLRQDVEAIRVKFRHKGFINPEAIKRAITRHRESRGVEG
jgi:hypothetical protein